ncbi:MAG: restriction endonuclease subunit S [Actinobacteria bacterium]|nr:restriction endonuclease subunit S [Actinomycetota bacterium]
MKSPWPTKKLKEIFQENKKSPFKVEDADNHTLGYPFFTSGGNVLRHSEFLVDGENLFLSTGGYAGVKYYCGKASYSTDTWAIKIKNALTKYIYYQILGKIRYIDEIYFRGSGLRHLQKKEFLNIEIPLPPVEVQRKIVGVLDTIQEAIEIQDKIIEKTKELKKAMMSLLFHYGIAGLRVKELLSSRTGELEKEEIEKLIGKKLKKTEIGLIPEDWKVVKLGEVCLKTQQKDPSKEPYKLIKYLDVSSIDNENFKIIAYKVFEGRKAPSRARKIIETDDIIFATVRPYLKRVALIPAELHGEFCSTAFCVIRTKKELLKPNYLFYYLLTNYFIVRISSFQSGTGYPAISDDDILNEKIPLPPLFEQCEIAEILQTIDQKIEVEQKKKALYEELFKTMLNKIMKQEIDVEEIHL